LRIHKFRKKVENGKGSYLENIKLKTTSSRPSINIVPKISLLYFAIRFGRKIPKLSPLSVVYFIAIGVKGHVQLLKINTIDSPVRRNIEIQSQLLKVFVMPA